MKDTLTKRNAALAEIYTTDEKDDAEVKRQKLGADAADVVFSPAGNTKTVAQVITPNHEAYHLVIDAVAEKYFQSSHVVPCQELQAVLHRQKALTKQGGIKRTPITVRNPATTTGLAVTATILEQLKLKEEQQRINEEAKEKVKKETLDKKVAARAADKAAAEEFRTIYREGCNKWEMLPKKTLIGAYKYVTNKELRDIQSSGLTAKKADIITAIKAAIGPEQQDNTALPSATM